MTITLLLDEDFYTGTGTSVDVPGKYDCALNGMPFMLDDKHDTFKGGISSIPLLRSQADQSGEPGESSTNPEDLWPRSQHTWHKGAGQRWLDHDDGDRARFWKSRGLDCWTRGQISTLNNTQLLEASANTNLALETAGDYVYMADGTSLKRYSDITTLTAGTVISQPGVEAASTIKSICSDGHTIYAAVGDGIHITLAGSGTSSHYSDLVADTVAYTKGRLMASKGAAVYNVTTSGAAPTALFTHPNSDWQWTCFTEGTGCIYFAGYSGDKSAIYFVTIKEDGTGLDVPKVACELPDGEIARSLQGYLGYLVVGTDKGFRLGTQAVSSSLSFGNFVTLGSLVPMSNPVLCFEPQSRFVWFGWSNFDSSFTGLGRMDLSVLTDPSVPAYASDLMYGSIVSGFGQQGSVLDVVTSHNIRLFAVSGKGLVREQTGNSVTAAYVETSEITYGIPDDKVALSLAIEHEPLPTDGAIWAYISVDGGDYSFIDKDQIVGSRHPNTPFTLDQVTGGTYRLKFQLTAETAGATALDRYTLRAYPVPHRGKVITVPLLLHENYYDAHGGECRMDPSARRDYVESLKDSGQMIRYQELGDSYSVFIDQLQFERHSRTQSGQGWNGVLACKLKVLGE